ncbi:mandelate racemase/muconate lactonizing enzyme family protein [Chloroflexi bacterium TSY]|nr:mandelate racemase/muconate lactonizing enzyme family protein [Chloroflexi bacterium TSY]
MKIAQIESYVIKLPRPEASPNRPDYRQSVRGLAYDTSPPINDMAALNYAEALFVKVTSDNGLVGWGEGQSLLVPEATKAIVDRLLAPILIGQNPLSREKLWDLMYGVMRGRGYRAGYLVAALAGIDNALWDLSGKALDIPCYLLLGGPYRERVRVYNNIHGATPEAGVAQALRSVEMGFDAVKYHLFRPIEEAVAIVEATREAMGPDVDILVDLTWHYDVPGAITLGRELQKFNVFWLESPVPSEDLRRHAEVPAALDLPICIGQEFYTAYQFRAVLEAHAADILLPDLARAGLTGGRRIAHLAETFDIPLAPAVGAGNVLSTAAQLQLSAGILNFIIMEHFEESFQWKSDLILKESLQRVGSYMELPNRPGLGVEIDEDKLRQYTVTHHYRNES